MNYCITPEFEELIGDKRLDSFNNHPSSIYGIDSKLNIAYLNPAWFKFAEENGNNIFHSSEWLLGQPLLAAIPDVLKEFYSDFFESAISEAPPKVAKEFEYECSSPDLYRRFSMHLYPVSNRGIVVVHSLTIEEPYKVQEIKGMNILDEKQYVDEKGVLTQCANCRRVENKNHSERWDWVPKWVKEPHPMTSHGLCRPCMQHYYLSDD